MMTRVLVPFTEGHYYGEEERPNTELADNSLLVYRLSLRIHYILTSTVADYAKYFVAESTQHITKELGI